MAVVQTTGASQTQEEVIGTFPVPYKGVHQDQSEVEIARDSLWIGENLHLFQGELRQRPSWNLARNATVAAPPAAAGSIVTPWSTRRPATRDQYLFVGGLKEVHVLGTAGWIRAKAWAATNNRWQQVRFTDIAIGTPLQTNVCIVNSVDQMVRAVLPVAGNPAADFGAFVAAAPIMRDICTASDRVVGITDTDVNWSANLDVTSWPALATKSLAETLDLCIAIRPLSTLNVGVWKERSLWIGQFAGGTDAAAFRWRVLRWVDGPASPNALCTDSLGNWHWMSKLGRIFTMDENFQITTPGDGVWPIVRESMSQVQHEYGQTHATYRPFYDEVWFFYGGLV